MLSYTPAKHRSAQSGEPCQGDPPKVPQGAARGSGLARADTRNEIRDFLTSRRAKLNAADVGLPDYGTRRVPGLRREEVAVLASVSLPYYTRLERGDLTGASDSVLEALARAATPRR